MDFKRITEAVEQLAHESDPEAAGRVICVYIGPGDAGLYVFRPGCGTYVMRAGEGPASDFAHSIREGAGKLWPEAPKRTKQWLTIASDFLARSPIARMLGGGGDEED